MTTELRSPGQTTVAPDVLMDIARLTALNVDGVHSMGSGPRWGNRRQADEGVHVHIEEDHIDLDLYLVLKKDVNLRQVGRDVQTVVTRAISEMVGMQPGRINIHIEDIFYPPSA